MCKKILFLALLCISYSYAQGPMTPLPSAVTSGSDWTTTNLTADLALNFPWEITYGPDTNLWITERVGEKIVRIGTSGGTITTMIDLSSKITNAKQGGLMGMAIHPDLFSDVTTTTNNYVYAAYTYTDAGLKLRIVRLVYNNATGTLTEDTTLDANGALLEGLPGSADHNSGRLIIGPDSKLYYTIGDQGANQFEYACDPVLSQVLPTSSTDYDNYPGKTLRINLDGSIPTDNPVLEGVQSHVYTYGHRNSQGIIFAQDGTLYNSEHGAKVDDEINVIEEGKNYGWPEIAGYYDNMAYTYCNWSSVGGACNASSFSDHNCPVGADTATEFQSYPTAADVPANFQPPIGTYGGTVAVDPPGGWFSWPSVAPSSIDIHEEGNIPGWGRSLLVSTLKKGTIYRAKLTPDGNDIVGDDNVGSIDGYEEFHSSNDRYRDIAISPDGLTIYAVTDNSGGTSGPSSGSGVSIENGGTIVKIEYIGPAIANPPVAICQDINVTLNTTGNATITASQIDNGSSAMAGIASLVIDNDSFDCSHVGTPQTVWLTVTDTNGDESRCTSTVTVLPNANPNPITAPMLDDIVSNCAVTVTAPTVISNGCLEVTGTTTDPVIYNEGESGTITWSFDDGVTTVMSTQNVTVNLIPIPTNFNITPGATTADVTWDPIDDVTFLVRYKLLGSSTWTEVTTATNSITLSGLTTLTNYELEVSSDCGLSQSAFSANQVFQTTDISYCTPTVDFYADDFYISNVYVEETATAMPMIDNTTTAADDVNGYSDHTGLFPSNFTAGNNYDINITLLNTHPWNKTTGHSVWIDYNQDGVFDETERVWGTTEGTNLFAHGAVAQGSFTIPTSALNGNTRMRIASRTYYTGSNPCSLEFDANNGGEFEDYTVNIVGNTLSLNTPNELSEISIYPNPIKNVVTIMLPSTLNYEELEVTLYDLQGRMIRKKSINYNSQREIKIDNLGNLNSGIYFIKVNNSDATLIINKLIKI